MCLVWLQTMENNTFCIVSILYWETQQHKELMTISTLNKSLTVQFSLVIVVRLESTSCSVQLKIWYVYTYFQSLSTGWLKLAVKSHFYFINFLSLCWLLNLFSPSDLVLKGVVLNMKIFYCISVWGAPCPINANITKTQFSGQIHVLPVLG